MNLEAVDVLYLSLYSLFHLKDLPSCCSSKNDGLNKGCKSASCRHNKCFKMFSIKYSEILHLWCIGGLKAQIGKFKKNNKNRYLLIVIYLPDILQSVSRTISIYPSNNLMQRTFIIYTRQNRKQRCTEVKQTSLRKDIQLRSRETGYQTKQLYSKTHTLNWYLYFLPGKWWHFWCLNPAEKLEMKPRKGSLSKNVKDNGQL